MARLVSTLSRAFLRLFTEMLIPSMTFAGNQKTFFFKGFLGEKSLIGVEYSILPGERAGVKNTCPSAVRRGQVSCLSAKTHTIAHHSIIFLFPIHTYTYAISSPSRCLSVRLNGLFGLFSLSPYRETRREAVKMPEEQKWGTCAIPVSMRPPFLDLRASAAVERRVTRYGKAENKGFYGACLNVRFRMAGVTTRRAESKTECRGRDKPLRLTRRKIRNPHVRAHTRAYTHTRTSCASCARYARIMLACARYASAGHYLINTNKRWELYLAWFSAFLGGVKFFGVFCCFFAVTSGMLNALFRGYYGSGPLPLL